LGFDGLIAMLNKEAQRLVADLGGAVRLLVKGLDLRPRLLTEKAKRASEAKPRKRLKRAKPNAKTRTRDKI
jgi:hypothetical protein